MEAIEENPNEDPADHDGSRTNMAVEQTFLKRHFNLLVSSTLALLVASITAVATLLGATVGAQGAYQAGLSQQNAAAKTERDDVARSKRAEIYAAFLKAADEMYTLNNEFYTFNYLQEIKEIAKGSRFPKLDTWNAANINFQVQANQIYVYGTDQAWEAALEIINILPPTVTGDLRLIGPPKPKEINGGDFASAYSELLGTMCREASAQPRKGCYDPP